jgi:hypothetical protein
LSLGFRRRRGDEGFQNKVRGDLVKFRSVKQSKKRLCARVGVFTRTRVSLRLGFLDSAPASGVSLAHFLPRVSLGSFLPVCDRETAREEGCECAP